MHWQTTRFRIDLTQPRVMGIVNVTPDSFSDGGLHHCALAAMRHCDQIVAEGADILDIGGESTRPGAASPNVAEELARILPVLRHAVGLGVDIVNDVRALQRPGALRCVAAHARAGVCLMHMRGEPDTMQTQVQYEDVVAEVVDFLRLRASEVEAAGVARERIVIDPGIGFGKALEHNLALLQRQRDLVGLGWPLLVGWSRKSALGLLTGRPVGERLVASVAAALVAVTQGAAIVRVHDVAATVDALTVWRAAQTGHLPTA